MLTSPLVTEEGRGPRTNAPGTGSAAAIEGTSEEVAARLRDALQLLVRAQKALRMYQGENPITLRLKSDLHQRLATILEQEGAVDLGVRQSQLLFGEEPVYDNRDRKESLAFLLFRDGVRRLTLHPGLDADELERFLTCLNGVRVLASGEDDLVTLFWEEDFHFITYVSVDELDDTELGGDVGEQLSSAVLAGGREGAGGGGGGDGVRLDDVKPLSRLPVEDAQLTEDEIESLRREIAAEQALDLEGLIPDLAAELTALEPGEEQRRQLAADLLAVLDARIEAGEASAVVVTVNRLGELARSIFADSEAVTQLQVVVKEGLCVPRRLDRFLAVVRDAGGIDHESQRFLARLPERSQEALVPWLGRLPRSEDRRAVADVLASQGQRCLAAIGKQLEGFLARGDRGALTEVLYLASQFPEASLPLLQRLLASSDANLRRETALVLGRFQGERVVRTWLELLSDRDVGLRSLAIAALARSRSTSAAREIVVRVAAATPERSEEELRRALAAAGRLAGDEALAWLAPQLQPERRRWFASRREQELARAAAYGIRVVGSEASRNLLATLAQTGDRICRAACAAELGEGG